MTLNQNDQITAARYINWDRFNLLHNPAAIDEEEANYRLGLAIGQYLEDLKESITDYTELGGTIGGLSEVIRNFNRDIEDYADEFGIEGLISKENFLRMMGQLVTGT